MSWDYSSSKTRCDHRQTLERYVLDVFDFRTLHYVGNTLENMRAPINGVDQVRVYLRGTLVKASHPMLGFSVVPDPNRVETNFTFLKIVFNNPLRMVQPLIEVTYLTRPEFCLKCVGLDQVNDWSLNGAGQLKRVTKTTKLAQQSLKYILTSKNPFNPSLCCRLRDFVGAKLGVSISEDDIANEVIRALSAYQTIQKAQQTVQTLDAQEILKDISGVAVRQDPTNPLLIYLTIQVTAYGATEPIPLNLALKANN